tara:strand:+ start:139 stop:798 length:660 start_codon:yes stop_codon:yes gene_type:complete
VIQTSFFPTEEEPEEIIPIHPEGFKPKKLEDVLPHLDILKDTYIIYPNGGYHPFYGVPNTLPRYQEKIWPFIKRIKFNDKWKGDKVLNRVRRGSLRENSSLSQVNAYLQDGYLVVSVHSNAVHLKNEYTRQRKTKPGHTKYLAPGKLKLLLHRIVGYAWVPNPHNKPLCMHLNDDRTNCLPENLKWGTARENNKGTIKRRPDTMEQKYLNCVMKGYIKG